MNIERARRLAALPVAGAMLVLLHACGNAPAVDQAADAAEHDMAGMAMEESAELESVRQLTASFTDIGAARAAGYTEAITSCWYHRDNGGQGIHFGRPELIDGTVSLLEPELVMYEPLEDGSLQFLAIEYIVPLDAWTEAEPPTLFDQQFMRNEQLGLWVLHVWLGKENPEGLYANWNPNVSCQHATESEDRAI